jgi:hypothetical protein
VIIHPSNTYLFHTAALYKDFLYQAQPDIFETFCCRSRRLLILWSNDLYQCDKNGGILLGNISIRPKTPRATIYSAEQGPGINSVPARLHHHRFNEARNVSPKDITGI